MATHTTRWPLSIIAIVLPVCISSPGPPAAPSHLECFRPCNERDFPVIQCVWDPQPHPDSPTTYHLRWEPANSDDELFISGNSSDGRIQRDNFADHEKLRVWVEAQNQHGSVKSEELVFKTEDIRKPPPPTVTSSNQDPLEIQWTTICAELLLDAATCEVRYRTENDESWTEHEDGFYKTYEVMDPQPSSIYEFQVRCPCGSILMSDWSKSTYVKSAESTPVGELDIWLDCSFPSSSLECFLTWKNLSMSQARGHILVYEVTVMYGSRTEQKNVSTADSSGLLLHDGMQWRLSSSLQGVSSVGVSAYNRLGATNPAYIVMPKQGNDTNDQIINVRMSAEILTVTWDSLPSRLSDKVKHFVAQYKACSLVNGFDWIKVDRNQSSVIFKGRFTDYTPYQVSLFTVSNSNEVHRLSTVTGFSVQGVPSTVPSFKVSYISATGVTLVWEPVPYTKRNGVILYYQIGVNNGKVYNVSVPPDHGNMTYKLSDLQFGQVYEAWIRAVTEAGPGAKSSTTFTFQQETFGYILVFVVVILVLVVPSIICVVGSCVCGGANKVCVFIPACLHEKVPDPRNSHIFRQMKHQISEPLNWICIPSYEPYPKISLLEVVEIKSQEFDSDEFKRLVMENSGSHTELQDVQREATPTEAIGRTEQRPGREAYSKMIDSDEEREDSGNLSEEDLPICGYEKHFMPSAAEIMAE